MSELGNAVAKVLEEQGFEVASEINVMGTIFDFVAEDLTKLVFVQIRNTSQGWLDDFANHQAAVATMINEVPLGRKWRDVYLLELTTDPIDNADEIRAAELMRSDTSIARKLVLDASGIDLGHPQELATMLSQLFRISLSVPPAADENVLQELQSQLEADGFRPDLVRRLLADFESPRHSCVDIVIEESS